VPTKVLTKVPTNKNEKNVKKRESTFLNELKEFKQYDSKLRESFYLYWTETNKTNTKMKFELQPTFDISRRLASWSKREKDFKPKQPRL